jgi:mono/diheme cytochrome c family protein
MFRTVLRAFALLVVLVVVATGAVVWSITQRGLSTRVAPGPVEEFVAVNVRRLATPRAARERVNPVTASDQVLQSALAHFADHCAVCHANDGSGETTIGQNLYPRAPDMRLRRTQALTDGELFWIIEHGIRLTGMPGWGTGTPEGERASWELVHFIRRLPDLTPEEILEMEALNPRTPAEFRAEEETRRFLAGEGSPPAAPHGH